jgi:two-component system, response regulator
MNYKSEIDILLIEDNPSDAELTTRALKEANLTFNLLTLTDGSEALDFLFSKGKYSERLINEIPRVILLDLSLPKVSGHIILGKIKTDNQTKNIPVVALTSSNQERDILDSYDLGVNSYIVKPIEFEKFVEVIKGIGQYWLLLNQPPYNN